MGKRSATQPTKRSVNSALAMAVSHNADTPDCSSSATQVISDTTSSDNLCGVCQQVVAPDLINTTSLTCCICDLPHHGTCLDINSTLISFLHVVVDIGGWCCSTCIKSKGFTKVTRKPKKQSINDVINNDLSEIKKQLNLLADAITKISTPHVPMPTSESITNQPTSTYASHLCPIVNGRQESSTSTNTGHSHLPNQSSLHDYTQPQLLITKTSMNYAEAVLSSKPFPPTQNTSASYPSQDSAQRQANIVVSGLPPVTSVSDARLFYDLCLHELNISPSIRCTSRLGRTTAGKIQPLLISLTSSVKAECILAVAKDLRKSQFAFIRDNIYVNRHLSPAELLTAYKLRLSHRQKAVPNNYQAEQQSLPVPTTTSTETDFNILNSQISSNVFNSVSFPHLPPIDNPK